MAATEKTKKKLLISIFALGGIIIIGLIAAIAVLAAATNAVKSSVSVIYSADGIFGTVSASYEGAASEDLGSVTFLGGDGTQKTLTPQNTEINLTKNNNYIIFTYTFTNEGEADYTANFSYQDQATIDKNMKFEYSTNKSSWTASKSTVTVAANGTSTYYIKVSIDDLTKAAELTGDFNWNLTVSSN